MKRFLRNLLAAFTAIILFVIMIAVIIMIVTREKAPDIDEHSWLLITLDAGLPEYPPPAGFPPFSFGEAETLTRILANLEKAAIDERIDGIVFRFDGYSDYMANMEEIRYALDDCKAAGKKIYAYATMMNRSAYFLASACDSVFMPITGYFDFMGMSASAPFIKGSLDMLGIEPEISKIREYKSAAELVMEEEWTDQARENREWMLAERWKTYVNVVGADRGLSEEQLVAAMEHALYDNGSNDGIEVGLLDEIIYWDELKDRIKPADDEEEDEWLVSSSKYAKVCPASLDLEGDKTIAVVHAAGMIGGKKSGVDPILGETMGYESVNSDLRKAWKDEDVAAIIFRVNSGGGDAMTSDMIARQIEIIAQDKPVVISMVGVAASGGYVISYRGTKILANESTSTGSIGSISGKFMMKGLYDKLGITWDFVTKGPSALMTSDYHNFTEEEWKKFQDNHLAGVHTWMRDVAERRNMSFEEIEELAYGRVWTGGQAQANGLIDEVGGFQQAIAAAKELAEIPEDEQVSILHYPEHKSPIEQFMGGGDMVSYLSYRTYKLIHYDIPKRLEMMQQGRWWYWNEQLD
jgi:protease-4